MWKHWGALNQKRALVGAFSVIVKTDCEADGSFAALIITPPPMMIAAVCPLSRDNCLGVKIYFTADISNHVTRRSSGQSSCVTALIMTSTPHFIEKIYWKAPDVQYKYDTYCTFHKSISVSVWYNTNYLHYDRQHIIIIHSLVKY